MQACWVYITTSSADEARRIGRKLVEDRLAACVNILESMHSIYWWEGQVQDGQEAVLIAKTTQPLVPALTERVKALHSYSVPCVVALPIVAGNGEYLDWIFRETRPPE